MRVIQAVDRHVAAGQGLLAALTPAKEAVEGELRAAISQLHSFLRFQQTQDERIPLHQSHEDDAANSAMERLSAVLANVQAEPADSIGEFCAIRAAAADGERHSDLLTAIRSDRLTFALNALRHVASDRDRLEGLRYFGHLVLDESLESEAFLRGAVDVTTTRHACMN